MSVDVKVRVFENPAAVARAVAAAIRDLSLQEADAPLTVALSGGSTPKLLYQKLASASFRERTRWERLQLFFGDERPVPMEHADSNYGMANAALLSKIHVEAHRMEADEGKAEAYERLIRKKVKVGQDKIPSFDLILLGMGADGHTASLFPGTEALRERERLVVMNEVPDKKTQRMTFTYPLINAARAIWVLVCGAAKRKMAGRCLDALKGDPPSPEDDPPIAGVRPKQGELVWWMDKAASG